MMHVTNISFDCYSIQLVRVGFLGLKEDKICNSWNVFAISKLMYLPCLNWYLDLNWRLLSRRKIKMGKLWLWPVWSASPGWQPSHKSCRQHRNRHRHHPHRHPHCRHPHCHRHRHHHHQPLHFEKNSIRFKVNIENDIVKRLKLQSLALFLLSMSE